MIVQRQETIPRPECDFIGSQKGIQLPFEVSMPTIALGGDLNCCPYVLHRNMAKSLGQFGDLSDAMNFRRFERSVRRVCDSFRSQTVTVAHDLHPSLLTTAMARALSRNSPEAMDVESIGILHHHAHVVSCAIDNGVTTPVVGIACDGNGYGEDGHNWGCEILVADATRCGRFGHLDYFKLPGGDAAAVEPWRCALSLLWQSFDGNIPRHLERVFAGIAAARVDEIKALLAANVACPLTSSLGRLFDSVSFLCGLCEPHARNGKAAQILESVADRDCEPHPFLDSTDQTETTIDPASLIRAICCDLTEHVAISTIAGRFHASVAEMLATLAIRAANTHGIDCVALSGGCFMNRLLRDHVCVALRHLDVRILEHKQVPCGDGGLALGQSVIAAAQAIISDKTKA